MICIVYMFIGKLQVIFSNKTFDICRFIATMFIKQCNYIRRKCESYRMFGSPSCRTTCSFAFSPTFAFLFFVFHMCKNNVTFVPTLQRGGGSYPPRSWKLNRYFECDSDFPNFPNDFKAHFVKVLEGFFLLPFKRFGFLFVTPFDYSTKIVFIFE